jgi:hypothetical protein
MHTNQRCGVNLLWSCLRRAGNNGPRGGTDSEQKINTMRSSTCFRRTLMVGLTALTIAAPPFGAVAAELLDATPRIGRC